MKSDRIWDLFKLVAPTKKLRKPRFIWETPEEYEEKRSEIYKAVRECGGNDDYFGLRAELAGEDFYPLIRIFNTQIISQSAIDIADRLIKIVYPKSNVYWNSEHGYIGYCHEYYYSKDFCPSLLAHICIGLLEAMYDTQAKIERQEEPYEGIWLLKEKEI